MGIVLAFAPEKHLKWGALNKRLLTLGWQNEKQLREKKLRQKEELRLLQLPLPVTPQNKLAQNEKDEETDPVVGG